MTGNFIGTNAAGDADLGNSGPGVRIEDGSHNSIGGTAPEDRNLISGNNFAGVYLVTVGSPTQPPMTGNRVLGNLIGTDKQGTARIGNGSGVRLENVFGRQLTGNVIGGTTAAARNVISGNAGSANVDLLRVRGNTVQGNFIGTDVTGTLSLRNPGSATSGVFLSGAIDNLIGGDDDDDGVLDGVVGARNVISGNTHGFDINNSSGNRVQGNFIGTDVTGTVAIANGPGFFGGGVRIGGGDTSTIGGTTPGAGNLISGNLGAGIFLIGTAFNVIQGNRIGTDVTGTLPLPNQQHGVQAGGVSPVGANNNVIGGTDPAAANIIAFNGLAGVAIATGTGNSILGNSIFGNTGLSSSPFSSTGLGIDLGGGDLAGDNVTLNDPGDADTGPNNRQNFPVLTEVISTAVASTVFGFLNSTSATDYLIQFFANASADPSGHGEGQTFLGETVVLAAAGGNVSFAAALPVRVPPGHHVTATATRLVDHDANPDTPSVPTDTSEFSRAINETVTELALGQTINLPIALGQELRFRLKVPPGTDARLAASFANPQIGEIFVLLGDVPDPNIFNLHAVGFVNPSPEFLLPGSPAPYLILIRGTSTAAVTSGTFSLSAIAAGLEIESVAPSRGSNVGRATTTIVGAGLTPATVFSLVSKTGIERPALSVVQQNDTTFFATFDLVSLAPGVYDVHAVDGPRSAVASDAFTVTAGIAGQFRAQLVLPGAVRNGREGRLFVEYANIGETDIPGPAAHRLQQQCRRDIDSSPADHCWGRWWWRRGWRRGRWWRHYLSPAPSAAADSAQTHFSVPGDQRARARGRASAGG